MHWIRRHRRGRPPHPDVLTPAEWRVLELVRDGRSNPEIAARLDVSVNTVRAQVSSMLAKLELPDRHALAEWEGEPAPASVAARRRLPFLAPLGWMRDAVTSGPAGKAALVGGIAVLTLATFAGLASVRGGDDGAPGTPAAPQTPTEVVDEGAGEGTADEPFVEVTAANDGAGIGLVDGLPPGAAGPLLVYSAMEFADSGSRVTVHVFDIGTGTEVSEFEIEQRGSLDLVVDGRRILATFQRSVQDLALDGTDANELWSSADRDTAGTGLPSPDGTLLAFATHAPDGALPGARRVLVVEIESGAIVLDYDGNPASWAGFERGATVGGWVNDHELLLLGGADTGDTAQALLDPRGAMTEVDAEQAPPVSPRARTDGLGVTYDGRLPASCSADPLTPLEGSVLYSVLHVEHRGTGQVVSTVDVGGPIGMRGELSPDGTALMYEQVRVDEATLSALQEAVEAGECPDRVDLDEFANRAADPDSREVRVHDLTTEHERAAADRLEVLREWYPPDEVISFECDGHEHAAVRMDGGRIFTPPGCFGAADMELRVGGITVERADWPIVVLGRVDIP